MLGTRPIAERVVANMQNDKIVIALGRTPAPKKGLAEINTDLLGVIDELRLEKKALELRNKILELQLLAFNVNDFEH
jgi:hypothetical protein